VHQRALAAADLDANALLGLPVRVSDERYRLARHVHRPRHAGDVRAARAPQRDGAGDGRKVEGADKPRLTVDESRRLQAYCHEHATTDPGAAITLAYLLLGSRASDLVKRDVRDLDDDGRLLWIGRTKTGAGTRRLLIPDELTPYLVVLAQGRSGDAPLFVSEASRRWPAGRRWSRHMAYNHVRRIASDAKVPVLPPQALRRTQATLAEDAGETALAVARHLGHATAAAPAVTHRSYVSRDTVRNAAVKRGLTALRGKRHTGNAETTAETDLDPRGVSVIHTRSTENSTCHDH
jgi:integrase